MEKSLIKQNILALSWEPWLERPFGAFVLSLWNNSETRANMRSIGVDAEMRAWVFENYSWHFSSQVMAEFATDIAKYLNTGGSIFVLSSELKKYYHKQKARLQEMLIDQSDPIKQWTELAEVFTRITSYVWLAHGLEEVYTPRLKEAAKKFAPTNITNLDSYIGDLTQPIKKNAHALFADALRNNESAESIVERFGWIRDRDGFTNGFTVNDIVGERAKVSSKTLRVESVVAPVEFKQLISEVQELIYFRTLRTDIFYELLYLARPITAALGKLYNLGFLSLRNYSIPELLAGNPIQHSRNITVVSYRGCMAFFEEPILSAQNKYLADFVKGVIAFRGVVRGTAKIVKAVADLDKVKIGDILITQMTFPSFIIAMKLASAFVTDEGGITCHAAIVARELQKPCVIGTKIATKIFKDGDFVEVDANTGIVKKIV